MKRVYLIIGASSDLGIAFVRNLYEEHLLENADIVLHYNKGIDGLTEWASRGSEKIRIHTVQSDLSLPNGSDKLIAYLHENGLIPTHIVSFAALEYRYNRMDEWNTARAFKDMQIQVFSFAELMRTFLPDMALNGFGKVLVMLSSCTISDPPKCLTEYTTVKYALLGLIRSAAVEYGDKGININAVSPAMIDTKFVNDIGRKMREINAGNNPRHRNLKVDDVIPLITFLLSEEAQFINGENIGLRG